jgi:hypothetical protein
LTSFTGLLSRGGTDEQVADALVGSQEYFQMRGDRTNAGFVSALFQDALNRTPTAGEAAMFVQDLQGGMSTGQVADMIFSSPYHPAQNTLQHSEYLRDVVTFMYQDYLRRAPDPAGLTAFISLFQNGTSDETAVALFIGSGEYFSRP